ncbi:MAG: hypothetical protein AAF724_15425 [Pseudomonadota bacterium]
MDRFIDLIELLNNWQTLVAGLLAFGGALWTVQKLRHQVKDQREEFRRVDKRHDELLQRYKHADRRRSLAAKAGLPHELDLMCNQTNYMALSLLNGDAEYKSRAFDVSRLSEAIEFLEDSAADRLYEILRQFQICDARLAGYFERLVQNDQPNDFETEDRLVDISEVRALTNTLFEYARNQTDKGPAEGLSADEWLSGLSSCVDIHSRHFGSEIYEQTIAKINLRFAS